MLMFAAITFAAHFVPAIVLISAMILGLVVLYLASAVVYGNNARLNPFLHLYKQFSRARSGDGPVKVWYAMDRYAIPLQVGSDWSKSEATPVESHSEYHGAMPHSNPTWRAPSESASPSLWRYKPGRACGCGR